MGGYNSIIVIIVAPCTSFCLLSEVLGRKWLTLSGWVNLHRLYELFIYFFFAKSYGRSSCTTSFLMGGVGFYDSSYLGEFLYLSEVIGIAMKLTYRESWVVAKTR